MVDKLCNLSEQSSLAYDLLSDAIGNVNWYDLAEHWIDTYNMNSDYFFTQLGERMEIIRE